MAFPWSARFWDSELLQCLGVGHRVKKIAIVGVKVYAIAVFADTAKASAELAKGVKAGTVKKADDASVCDVLVKGAFNRVVQLQLVRDVDGPTFIDAIRKAIEKRMTEAKQLDKLQQFEAFFLARPGTLGTAGAAQATGKAGLEGVPRPCASLRRTAS